MVDPRDPGPVGNVYDKYGTRNPIARWLMRGFLEAVTELAVGVAPRRVLEVGCGEGHLARHLYDRLGDVDRFEITDVSLARLSASVPEPISTREASVYELPYDDRSFDLVVCCEVLEHLEDPRRALAEVSRVASDRVLVSTPREPIWRVLNVLRGKYLADLGNTPGHLQHFGSRALVSLCGADLHDLRVRRPVPWTVVLGRPRRGTMRPR